MVKSADFSVAPDVAMLRSCVSRHRGIFQEAKMYSKQSTLAKTDPDLWAAIRNENRRQEDHIELIASENYVSWPVLEAQGSQLTNKYAEGYPGKRYYGGCEHVDVVEQLAIDREESCSAPMRQRPAQFRFAGQPGRVLMAFLKPGDTILGMNLAMGGHLTHGMPLNMSGKWFNVVPYGLDAQRGDRLRRRWNGWRASTSPR
jgi:glycine hydroxymethyltransferase